MGGAAGEEIRQVPRVASKVEGTEGAFHSERPGVFLHQQYENSSITCFLTGEKKVAPGCLLRLEDPPHSSPPSGPSPLFPSPKGGDGGDVNSQGRREESKRSRTAFSHPPMKPVSSLFFLPPSLRINAPALTFSLSSKGGLDLRWEREAYQNTRSLRLPWKCLSAAPDSSRRF